MSAGVINVGTYAKPCTIKLNQIYCRVQLHAHTGVYSKYSCSNIKQLSVCTQKLVLQLVSCMYSTDSISVVTDLVLHKVVKISSVESSGSIR